ncbi:MAG TPA: hypothetical protein VE993_03625 [Stellaceae bacterium]|nr:hypothetical protein [Stellaceae bacterium]
MPQKRNRNSDLISEENTPATAASDELSLENECYAVVNLSPRMTGVSRHVFVSPRIGSHDIRIKVSGTPGKNTLPVGGAAIGLCPRLHHIAGPTLPADVTAELEKRVAANLAAPVAYWEGDIDTGELLAALKRI